MRILLTILLSSLVLISLGSRGNPNSNRGYDSSEEFQRNRFEKPGRKTPPPPIGSRDGRVRVEFEDKAGAFKLFSGSNAATSKRYLKLLFVSLEELTSQSKKLKPRKIFDDLEDRDFNFTKAYTNEIPGKDGKYNVTQINFETSFLVGSSDPESKRVFLTITAQIFSTNVDVSFGNKTINVKKNNLKWTVQVSQWPFENDSNQLKISIKVQSRGGKDNASSSSSSSDEALSNGRGYRRHRLRYGKNLVLELADFAVIKRNGDTQRVNVTTKFENRGFLDGKLYIIFPNFDAGTRDMPGLKYDPVMAVDDPNVVDPNNPDSRGNIAFPSIFITLILALFATAILIG